MDSQVRNQGGKLDLKVRLTSNHHNLDSRQPKGADRLPDTMLGRVFQGNQSNEAVRLGWILIIRLGERIVDWVFVAIEQELGTCDNAVASGCHVLVTVNGLDCQVR